MPEGAPTTKPSAEDAAHFLIRMVHKYPHEITIYAGGPLTNLALATALDPEFPKLAQELVFMRAHHQPRACRPGVLPGAAARLQLLVGSRGDANRLSLSVA